MRDYEELVQELRTFVYVPAALQAADAIEELHRENESYANTINEASEILRNRLKSKWISVEERLPDVKKEVIVCDKMPNGMRYVTTAFMLEDCAFLNDCGRMYEVTHWMPLPEPPKEDDDA